MIIAGAALFAGPGVVAPAMAEAASPWAANDHARVRLVSAVGAYGGAKSVRLGLEFRLRPGWKIYWRSPGDAGVPPAVDWKGSRNLASATIRWPLPERYNIFGLTTLVYSDRVILPIDAVPGDAVPGGATSGGSVGPLEIAARVSYLVCEKICVPYDAPLALTLGPGPATPSAHAADVALFEARVPPRAESGAAQPFAVKHARISASTRGPVLQVLAEAAGGFTKPDLFVEGPVGITFGLPRIEAGSDGASALFTLPVTVSQAGAVLPEATRLKLTLADRGRGVEQVVTATVSRDAAAMGRGIAAILLLAFLGGLILNLMPCVLPVLSLKILSVVGHGGGGVGPIRRGFLATAAGILFSFLVLAGFAIVLRASGAAVGWGIQFQEPLFLAFMAALVTAFAANLFGFFEVPLPGFARGLGGGGDERRLGGAFATGAFATLLATPCSAPFLGTAVGFALTRGVADILMVFAALGIGLATPYLVVAAFPHLAAMLPRPGPWMERLRKVLGVVLVVTALWLGSVLWQVAGPVPAVACGVSLAAVFGLIWMRAQRGWPGRGVSATVTAVLIAVALAVPALAPAPAGAPTAAREAIDWVPFDRVAIFNHVAEGRTVFVDVTADWCITCKANKALVIDRSKVAARLNSPAVIAMRADWTRRDPAIAAYLRSFGRFGIPFNAVYGPALPAGRPLPELLTSRAVLTALDAARAQVPLAAAGR
jgi:suppressor for copper-sensitivity B